VFASDELDDDDFICLRFFGGALTAVGMADYAKSSINNMLAGSTSEEGEEGEDQRGRRGRRGRRGGRFRF